MEKQRLHLLLVDDDEDDHYLMKRLFSSFKDWNVIIDWVRSYAPALEMMLLNQHDVYLLDYRLGDADGLKLLQEAYRGGCNSPIIMLTGSASYEVDVMAMQSGAADFLEKDHISSVLLERSIRYALERKRSEELLKESETRFRMLLESAPDAMVIVNENGNIVLVNSQTEILFGYTRDELIAQPIEILIPEQFRQYHDSYRARYLEYPQVRIMGAGLELYAQRKDGSKFPVEISLSPIETSEGILIASAVRDSTQRKRTDEAIKASIKEDHQFQIYLKTLHDITVELMTIESIDKFYKRAVELGLQRLGFDRLGLLLYDHKSAIAAGTYGTDARGNVIDEHDLRFSPTDLTGILMRSFQREERFALDEHIELYSNYEVIGMGWNAAAVLWNGTEKLGWLAADNAVRHMPVTQPMLEILALYALAIGTLLVQKQTQIALRESEEQYRALFNQIVDAIFIHDEDANILDVNQAACERLGYSREELLRMKTTDIDAPDYASKFHARLEQQFEIGKLLDIEGVHVARDGHYIPIHVNSQLIMYKNKAAVLAVARDVTELRRSEEHSVELAAERAQVKLLADFIRDVSHDFRTPLTAIGTSSYLLWRATDPPKRQSYLQNIELRIKHMTHLIDRLLLMAQLDSSGDYELQPIRLDNVLRIVNDRFAPIAQERGIALNLQPPDPSLVIGADKNTISQAISEIVDNAISFTPGGGVVTLQTHTTENAVVITISDTGEGIADEILPHIFKRLYRGDEARSMERGAVGLGLAIAEKIIDRHKGMIQVENRAGSGAAFRILLPLPM